MVFAINSDLCLMKLNSFFNKWSLDQGQKTINTISMTKISFHSRLCKLGVFSWRPSSSFRGRHLRPFTSIDVTIDVDRHRHLRHFTSIYVHLRQFRGVSNPILVTFVTRGREGRGVDSRDTMVKTNPSYSKVQLLQVEKLKESYRGLGGFGSTGDS